MATGVVIRLKNLPLAAGTIDIRRFFTGLRIPDGGVHIIGGEDGTAFILFSTDEDARRAMLQDNQSLCGAAIKLMLSSHTEMKTVIEQSQRICEKLRGQRPPDPPITNLSGQSNVTSFQNTGGQFQRKQSGSDIVPENLDMNDVYIEIKGMPYSVNKADIIFFFTPLSVSAIKFMLDEKGRKNGSGYIKFATPLEKLHGLKRDRKFIGSRFVKLASVTERQWLLANSQPNETVRLVSDNSINRKRQQSLVSPDEDTPKRSRTLSPLKTDNCVEIRGLPSSATFKDVGDLFYRLAFVDGGVFVEMDGSKCKGIAYVEFSSYADYKLALEKDGDMVNGKQVRVVSLSKQNMLDQINKHKRYCKAKREDYDQDKKHHKKSRENEQQKRKEHHVRKNRDMDEWLQRQHQKEEKERKKADANQKALAEMEEKKQLQQLLFDKKILDSLKATDDFQLSEELKRKILQIAEKSTSETISEKVDEPLQGAGEMDIEEDNNDQPSENENKIQQNIAVSSAAYGFPVLGNSGSVVAPQLPLGFNPSMALLSPPPFPVSGLPGLPPNLPSFSSPGLLPILTKPPIFTTQAGSLNPPLPPSAVFPPVPPVNLTLPPAPNPEIPAATVAPPPVVSMPSQLSAATTSTVSVTTPIQNASSNPAIYVRVANSPYNVTEVEVRNFFGNLFIPEHGIQFINKPNGQRSGHIFIKFSSEIDAAMAAQKADQMLNGRAVLIKATTLSSLSSMFKHIVKNPASEYIPTFDGPKTEAGNVDSVFTKRILEDKMTCVCIGNIPPSATEDDIVRTLNGIRFDKNKIVMLRDVDGKCRGDVYVELESPEECVKAANLHNSAKVLDQFVRVLPLTLASMQKDVENRRLKPINNSTSLLPSNGHLPMSSAQPVPDTKPGFPINPPPQHFDQSLGPGMPKLPQMNSKAHLPSQFDSPLAHQPMLDPPVLPPQPFHDPVLPFAPPDITVPPPTDDFLRMPPPGMLDPAFGLPPIHSIPPPMPSTLFMNRPPPIPFNQSPIKTIKMSNLSFKVTREDILEFFVGFDPLPDSIRLMYNNNGKPTGDGIISFPNFEVAKAAVEQLNSKLCLARKIRLTLQ